MVIKMIDEVIEKVEKLMNELKEIKGEIDIHIHVGVESYYHVEYSKP